MRVLWRFLPIVMLLAACVQIKAENAPVPESVPASVRGTPRRSYRFRVDISSQIVGFTLMVNGVEILVGDGGTNFTSQVNINDWMVSGNNDITITISWPDGVSFTPGASSASFKLFSNNTLLREFNWPAAGIQDTRSSYPYTFDETFRAGGFPRVMLERAERVISSTGVLPRDDQAKIAAIAEQLRRAFAEKNTESIDNLLRAKYADLAAARFTTFAVIKAEADAMYRELMEKEGYTVFFSGRNSFFSAADDRAVLLGQGRIGFPEPALIITWRDGRRTNRWTMDLYFARIDGNWVIIR